MILSCDGLASTARSCKTLLLDESTLTFYYLSKNNSNVRKASGTQGEHVRNDRADYMMG